MKDKIQISQGLVLLLIQPIFMATNTIVARGGVEAVPPISLAFWRWFTVFIILFPFFFDEIFKNKKEFNKEFFKLFFLGSMGCGICGAFPNLAGMTTTMANIGIIYTSSPVIIIFLSILFFKERINFFRILGLLICISGVFTIISKGNLDFLINLNFTIGDLWVLGAALGWALYSIYLLNWKSKFSLIKKSKLPLDIIVKTPVIQINKPNILKKLIFSLKNRIDKKIIMTGEDV